MISDHVLPKLVYRNGFITKNGEAGDAMSANAAMAAWNPTDLRCKAYVECSFRGDRPFRSPEHAENPNVDLNNSFSRDHALSLTWYALFTGDTTPLEKIARYAASHWLKIGKEGSYSQHGLTPNVMWAFASVGAKVPWYFRMWPSVVIAGIQLASAKTVAVSYRLNLCAELYGIAKLTGRDNWVWKKVIDVCVERQPENLYYVFLQGKTPEQEIEEKLMQYAQNYEPSHEWAWCWMHKTPEGKLLACGPELLLLHALLKRKP
jgi:hypothetical protein